MHWSFRCFHLLCIAFLAVLHGRCAREITIDLPEEDPKLVAISHFSPTEPFRVKITVSQPVYGNAIPITPEVADVTISKNGLFVDKLFSTFTAQGSLYWESRENPVPGQQYAMVVRVPGYPTLETTSVSPVFVDLEPISISAKDIDTIKYNETRYELRIPLQLQVKNLPTTNQFFAFKLSHEIGVYDYSEAPPELLFTSTSDSTFFLADGRTLSLLYNIAEPAVLINENFWNEDRSVLSLIVRIAYNPKEEQPRQLFVEWRTLSEDFYRYHLSIARQGSSVPLSEPDAVYNNIKGGYGNFSGFSSKTYTVELAK
jgi:hypothetical protein